MADNRTVIAVTVISRTIEPGKPGDKQKGIRPTPPKVQMIQPKTVFQTQSKEEFDELMSLGAIRLPEKDEQVAVDPANALPKAKAAPKKTSTPAGGKTDNKGDGKTDNKGGSGDGGGSGDDLV